MKTILNWVRRSLTLPVLMLMCCSAFAADTQTTGRVVIGSLPVAGNTITINGNVRTWRATVTIPSIEVTIGGTVGDCAQALVDQLAAYPLANVTAIRDAAMVYLVAPANIALTASASGSWSTVTVTTTTFTQRPLILPLGGQPAVIRAPQANQLVDALRDYASQSLPATSIVTGQLMSTGTVQTITALKTFTGGLVASNANNLITGGAMTNTELNRVLVKAKTNNVAQGIYFYDTNGVAQAVIMADIDTGLPVLLSIFSGVPYIASSTVPDRGNILNAAMGDYRYGQLAALLNTWSGTNRFVQITNSAFVNGTITGAALNNVTINASAAFLTNPIFSGAVVVTNSSAGSILRFFNGAAAVNEKQWDFSTSGNEFSAYVYADDLSSAVKWFRAIRSGVDVTTIYLTSSGVLTLSGSRENLPNTVVIGADMTPPASMTSGLMLNNGTAPSADPATGVAVFSVGGDLQARGSTATGGSGQNWHVFNAMDEVVGSGSDFSFPSTAYARVDFGGTDPEIALPTGGTYMVTATIPVINGATAADVYSFKLYNSTDAADVASSEQTIDALTTSASGQVIITKKVVVSTGKTIQLYGKNASGARGSVKSTRTLLSYVRLY